MKLKKFKERDNKRIGIIVFTIVCIFLVSGAVLYRTFAIFEVKTNQNVINGEVQDMGDLEFAFYKEVDGKDTIVKEVPTKDEGYSLDTSSSYCIDLTTGNQVSNVSWNDERWSIELKNVTTTKTKCYLHFKKLYKDPILNGADPDLMNGRLVPVQIKEEQPAGITVQNMSGSYGGKVVKADITNKWYSYADKQWANAVILKNGVVDNYSLGQEIEEKDIEAYFVWIPRYKYKLINSEDEFNKFDSAEEVGIVSSVSDFYNKYPNLATNNSFEIVFETKNGSISTTTFKEGDWITHPAFTTFDSNGFWVGKFETGYNQNADTTNVTPTNEWNTTGAQHDESHSTKVIIKPNVYSWRNINVSNAFYTSYEYKRELESHMMKNTEWGAVAYLTQSKYGRCEANGNCSEVRINNSENYITGMSAKEAPTCGYTGALASCNFYEQSSLTTDGQKVLSYYNNTSQKASTTGNYTGIYDMSGGAWELVMGVMQTGQEDGTPTSGRSKSFNSGFLGKFSCPSCDHNNSETDAELKDGKAWPSSKYYDLYDYSTSNQQYQRGILGDGTKEFGPFYRIKYQNEDIVAMYDTHVGSYNTGTANFVKYDDPWFRRGGHFMYGTDAGLENFDNVYGQGENYTGFRIVLTP